WRSDANDRRWWPLDVDPTARVIRRPIPVAVLAVPVVAVREEDGLVVVGDHANTGRDVRHVRCGARHCDRTAILRASGTTSERRNSQKANELRHTILHVEEKALRVPVEAG